MTKFKGTIENGKLKLLDPKEFQDFIIGKFKNGEEIEISIKKWSYQRTEQQNNALHLYFSQVAEVLNAAGLTIEKVIAYFTMEHEWTTGTVKEIIWREAQRYAVGKESTADLDKLMEINKTWEIVNRFLAKLKVESIPFPSIELWGKKIEKELEK